MRTGSNTWKSVSFFLMMSIGACLFLGRVERVFSQDLSSPQKILEVPFVRNRISVNGILDEWKEYKGIRFSPLDVMSGSSSRAWVRCTWDEEKLYLALRVKDDSLFAAETSDAGTPWRDDAIEVYLSVDPAAAQEKKMSPNEYQFIVNLNGAVGSCRGTTSGERDHSWDADILSGVRWQGSLNDSSGSADKEYTVEIAIPWRVMGVEPQADLELLVDFAVTDRRQEDTATADLFYYDWAGLPKFGDPTRWNKLVLRRAPGAGVNEGKRERSAAWIWLLFLGAVLLLWWMFSRFKKAWQEVEVMRSENKGESPEVMDELENRQESKGGEGSEEISDGLRVLARRVKQILVEEYASDLSAASVAERLRVSERHMRRALNAAEGQNFSKMLQQIRLKKACELLANKELSIAEVALEVGFGEQSYFSKLFKSSYGVSPTEYRVKSGEAR
ncbi:MAG: helix-turn-helix domain-containing protein [Verrucomicrobiota bacterium]